MAGGFGGRELVFERNVEQLAGCLVDFRVLAIRAVQVVVLCDVVEEALRRLGLEHGLDVAVHAELAEVPEGHGVDPGAADDAVRARVRLVGRPEVAPLVEGDEEEEGRVEDAGCDDVDAVEVALRDEDFGGQDQEEGEDVEGWEIGEDGVGFDAFEGEHCAAEIDFGSGVCGDEAEGVGQHGDKDGEEERVAEEGEEDHECRAEDPVEVGGALDPGPIEPEPDPDHPFRDCDR